MSITQKTPKEQGFLFCEPSYAETAVWAELSADIDPSQWASLCRRIGTMTGQEFEGIKGVIDSYLEHRMAQNEPREAPLVSVGPSGLRGEYQREIRKGHKKGQKWSILGMGKVLLSG